MSISKQDKGFTLLEILLVIAAIGILAAIVLVAINPNRQLAQARNLVRQADINTIQKALEQYLIDNGRYPTSVSTTPGYICNTGTEQTGVTTTINCNERVDLRELVPDYIASIPKDPQAIGTNTGYMVAINPDNNRVSIQASLSERGVLVINPLNIVKDGLVINLDAGNVSSYPGTGTTWLDLSISGNNGTLVNGVGYNSSNGGELVFDGVNDYVNFGNSYIDLDLSDKSFQVWLKKIGSSQKGVIDKEFDTGGENYGGWGFWIQPNNKLWWWSQGFKDLRDDGPISIVSGVWTNVAVTYDITTKTASFYINGQFNSQKTDISIVDKPSGVSNLVVGALRSGLANFYFDGNISILSAYNKVLSLGEIQQNFNATRGRFGL
jgi:prepilin-type N-terminal cleavage/methylation domain-containing protein